MNFIQPNFFIFITVFLIFYAWLGAKFRVSLGIIASFYFYSYFSPSFAILLLISSMVDYAIGARLYLEKSVRRRKVWLMASLLANLGMLFYFKYFDFFMESLSTGFPQVFDPVEEKMLPPMGISFFTFQTMSYTIDIYRKRLEPVRGFKNFLLFISFFPQLVAGPIVRAKVFLPQISKAKLMKENFWPGLFRFLRGFAKKACLADSLGLLLVDPLYANPTEADPYMAWLGMTAYGLQVYLDFSGYSDMAIGLGRILGYRFPENFNYPFLARSLSDLWSRWHISLSSWIRDYVYLGLRGKDRSKVFRRESAIVFSMTLSGLWHGAAWTFVIWGILHGVGMVVEKGWRVALKMSPLKNFDLSFLGGLWAIPFFFISLVFFRAHSYSDAIHVYGLLWSYEWSEGLARMGGCFASFENMQLLILFVLSVGTHVWKAMDMRAIVLRCPLMLQVFLWSNLCFWLIHFYPSGKVSPFIYFQF